MIFLAFLISSLLLLLLSFSFFIFLFIGLRRSRQKRRPCLECLRYFSFALLVKKEKNKKNICHQEMEGTSCVINRSPSGISLSFPLFGGNKNLTHTEREKLENEIEG
jgi:hypothetical protein